GEEMRQRVGNGAAIAFADADVDRGRAGSGWRLGLFRGFGGFAAVHFELLSTFEGGSCGNTPIPHRPRIGTTAASQYVGPLDANRKPADRATPRTARRAVDAALCRDRGRLLGLLGKWQAHPEDAALREAFQSRLQASVAERERRAAQLPKAEVVADLPIAA